MAIASPGKNWGFCSDECSYINEEFKYNIAYAGLGLMVYLSAEKCQEYLGVYFYLIFQKKTDTKTSNFSGRNDKY